jgi:hypothetical protein
LPLQADNAVISEIFGFSALFVQLVALPLLSRCMLPRRVLLFGLCFQCASQLLHALATNKLFLFVVTGVTTFGSVCFPAVSAIKSTNVDETEQVCVW